jgi:hypothetical protein
VCNALLTGLSGTPSICYSAQRGENLRKISIRNPLLYPAELRAQLRSEVAANECDVQVFPGGVR